MNFVKHTPWFMPLLLIGAVLSVPLVREPAQVQVGTGGENTSTNGGESQSKIKPPASAAFGRVDDQPKSAKGGQQPASDPKTDNGDGVKWTDAWIAILTAALAFLAAGQFFAASLQAKWTRKAVEVAKESADTARVSADAAKRSVEVMESNAEKELRAYIHISSGRVENFSTKPRVVMTIKNFGQTPAVEIKSWVWVFFDTFPPSPRDWDNPPKPLPLAIATLPAGGPANMAVIEHALDDAGRGAIKAKTHALYAYGVIRYKDVFKKDRHTKFRYYLGGRTGIPADGSMSFSDEGNDAS